MPALLNSKVITFYHNEISSSNGGKSASHLEASQLEKKGNFACSLSNEDSWRLVLSEITFLYATKRDLRNRTSHHNARRRAYLFSEMPAADLQVWNTLGTFLSTRDKMTDSRRRRFNWKRVFLLRRNAGCSEKVNFTTMCKIWRVIHHNL